MTQSLRPLTPLVLDVLVIHDTIEVQVRLRVNPRLLRPAHRHIAHLLLCQERTCAVPSPPHKIRLTQRPSPSQARTHHPPTAHARAPPARNPRSSRARSYPSSVVALGAPEPVEGPATTRVRRGPRSVAESAHEPPTGRAAMPTCAQRARVSSRHTTTDCVSVYSRMASHLEESGGAHGGAE